MFDTADVYSRRHGRGDPRQGDRGTARQGDHLDQGVPSAWATGPNDVGSSRHHLMRACEASLERLGTDYIDLYQLHGFDALTPVEETLSTLDTLVQTRQGPLHRLLELLRAGT